MVRWVNYLQQNLNPRQCVFTFEFCITWYQTTVRCTDRHPWGALYKSGRDDIGASPLAKDARWQDYANHLIEAKCD